MRPLLIGMCNPLSDDPECDLYPYPEGSAGWRLWQMLPEGTTRAGYLRAFDRRNLLRARVWNQPAARAAVKDLLPALEGRMVIILGTQVRAAFGLLAVKPLQLARAVVPIVASTSSSQQFCTFEWAAVPHPSGRNRWYNEPGRRAEVGAFLMELVSRCAGGARA